MSRVLLLGALLCALAAPTSGQPARAPAEPGIQDNSFLVEEAYNQEPGVVQHIQQFSRDLATGSWVYTYTEEWPVPGVTHQLSATVGAARVLRESGREIGLGDAQLNYRYQLVGNGEAAVAMAPRISLLLPTGSFRRELGLGAAGLQVQLPASVVLSSGFVVHANAGGTWVPRARDAAGDRATLVVPNLGASVVWLAAPTWNLLCEAVWARGEAVAGPGRATKQTLVLVNPGARIAWNFASGLQIVGGVGVPLGVGQSRGNRSILLYLSFEHPVWKAPKG